MRVLYLYNPHDALQVKGLETIVGQFPSYVEEVVIQDFQEVQHIYHISATPAVIIIREDLQGNFVFDADDEKSRIKLLSKLAESLQIQERELYGLEADRIGEVAERKSQDYLAVYKSQIDSDMSFLGKIAVRARKVGIK